MDKRSTQTFYRIVLTNPPTEYDFTSAKERGETLFDPRKADVFEGVSVYAKICDARDQARTYPDKGEWLAEIRITERPGLRIAKTGRRRTSHHTVWAAASVLHGCVVDVHHVNEVKR